MKKILVPMLLCLLLAFPAMAQQKSDREITGLKGPVKKIQVETAVDKQEEGNWVNKKGDISTAEYDGKGRTIQRTVRLLNGALMSRYTYTYDDAGNPAEAKTYGSDDKLTQFVRYAYNSQGKLITATHYAPDGSVRFTETHGYDDNGREIEGAKKFPEGGSKFVKRYDEQGRLLENTAYAGDVPDSKALFFYNQSGKLDKIETYGLKKQKPVLEGATHYTADGRETEQLAYDADGTVDHKDVIRHDEQGNVIEEAAYGRDGALIAKSTTTYEEFDRHGNWLKRKRETTLPDLKPIARETTTRTITYEDGIGPGPGQPVARVDTKPVPLNRPTPEYTSLARSNGVEGTVRVRVLIGPDGLVKQVRLVRGLPDGLEEAAIRAAYKLKFKPAMVNGQPVNFWAAVDVEFRLKR